ncbi:MAG: hypothetical protein N3F66_12560 [Spirochaetes bacterium]|nr:hypothetical protein [Spirochaetota bacterium]
MIKPTSQLIHLFDIVNDAIIIYDKNKNVVVFNNEKAEKLLQKNGHKAFFENEKIKSILTSIQNDTTVKEHLHLSVNKKVYHYKINALAISDDDTSLVAFVITDTTRLYKLHKEQQQLIAQIRKNYFDRFESLKQLADSIAHEVRNPLVSIGGYAHFLIRKCEEGIDHNEAKKFLSYIVENAERLNYLTQQIEEMGDLKRVQLSVYDITKFLHEQQSTLEAAAQQFNKKLQMVLESHSQYHMYIDYDRLRFALTRIVEFIAQHSREKIIEMRCHDSTYEFIITFSFTTEILSEEDLPYIFDPFYTTRSNVETFNLCIAQRIIMLHGGIITPELKKNTILFRIALPQDKRLT